MPEPIFIVGAPRSGTTLLASMIAGHAHIACGPETQFVNKLLGGARTKAQVNAALNDPAWPRQAVRLITSLTLAEQPVAELFGHSESDLQAFLEAREPSVAAMLESLTALYAAKQGKPRWAEKTPNHLLYLPTIRALYPGAPVVRIVRDPRDSAFSMRQLPWASRSALANSYLWDDWFRTSQPFFEQDAHTFTLRYEDLVKRPEEVLTRVCTFIGETFEPAMLDTQKTARNVSSPNESWKAQNARKLDQSRTQLWQKDLSLELQWALTHTCAAGIKAFGYPCPATLPETPQKETPKQQTLRAYPLDLRAVETFEQTVLELSARGTLLVEAAQPGTAELLLLPSLGRGNILANLLKLSRLLLVRRSKNETTYYLKPKATGSTGSKLGVRWAQLGLMVLCRTLATPYTLPTAPNLQPTSLAQPASPPAPRRRSRQRIRYWVRWLGGRPSPHGRARD